MNRTFPVPGNYWKGLRLDFGPNVQTGGTTNWHWNHSGAGGFRIADHTLAGPGARFFGNAMRYGRPVGRGLLGLGIAIDAISLGMEVNRSLETGNWSNTGREAAGIAGGWVGAWAGAKGGAMVGAYIGSLGGPLGILVGGAIGGILGGVGGYLAGSSLARAAFDIF